MYKIKKYLTYIILATFPIMSILNIGNNAKFNLSLADIFVVVLGIAWLIDIKKIKLKKDYPYFWYFIIIICVFLISNVYNLHSGVSSSGVSGLVSEGIKFVISAIYLFVGYNTIENKTDLNNIIKFWIVGLWVFIVYGLYLQVSVLLGMEPWRFNNALGNGNRFLGTITDANAAALYLSISFFVIVWARKYLFMSCKCMTFLTITNVFCFICIMLTMSRGGIIGFSIGLCVYISCNMKYFVKKLYLVPILLLIGLSILYVDTSFFQNQFSNSFISRSVAVTEKTGMFEIRLNLSKAAIDMGIDNPILGVGRGNYALNSKGYIIDNVTDWDRDKANYENMVAHNTLAGMFAELGIIGLLAFINIFVILIFKIVKSKDIDKGFKLLLLSLWSSIFVQSLVICLENARGLWIILGLSLAILDRHIDMNRRYPLHKFKENITIRIVVAAIGLILSVVVYLDIAPKYIYGDIDISKKEIILDYTAKEMGEYILRYNVYNQKKNENSDDMEVSVIDSDTNDVIQKLEYKMLMDMLIYILILIRKLI